MEENKLYDLQDEPLRLNRFICEITLDGVQIDSRVVRGFQEMRFLNELFIDIVSYEDVDYDWLIEKCYKEKIGGKLTFKWLSPSLKTVKVAKYDILSISNIIYPEYMFGTDEIVTTKVGFKYGNKNIEYFINYDGCTTEISNNRCKCNWDTKPTNYPTYSHEVTENEKAFLKAYKELLEDTKKRVEEKYSKYKNTEDKKKDVINAIERLEKDNDAYVKEVGCSDVDIENAKYKEPNGLEVEKYKRYLKKKREKVDTTFEFGDFNTALEWYKNHMIPTWRKGYVEVPKYSEVDNDIVQNRRSTVVVCSRQCGITTHMVAWSLAYISTCLDGEIWYVTHTKDAVFEILKNIPESIRKLSFLEISQWFGIIENTETKSKIRFISINRSLPDFFRGKNLPDYVIYDDMAFYNTGKLNEFITLIDARRTNEHHTKEICVSTPSKGGSIFNFIALTAENPIYIPWYEANLSGKDKNFAWAEKMKELIGDDNFNVECNCKIGCDEKTKPEYKDLIDKVFSDIDDKDFWFEVVDNECNIDNESQPKEFFPEDYKLFNDCKHKPYRKERFADDYGYCFKDENDGFGNNCCDKEENEI